MKIRLVIVGRLGDGPADRLTSDYVRRVRRHCAITLTEVRAATGRAHRGASRSERETRAALDAVGEREALTILDQRGDALTSEQFARWLDRKLSSRPSVAFLVGGADGFSDEARTRAERMLSLSPMTLPHEIARAMLAEQLYRAFAILKGTPYHR